LPERTHITAVFLNQDYNGLWISEALLLVKQANPTSEVLDTSEVFLGRAGFNTC
jgi:hypothetical protein